MPDDLDPHKSPDTSTAGEIDIVGVFHIVKRLILGQFRTEPAGRQAVTGIVLTPEAVGIIQGLGTGFRIRPELDVPGGV